MGADLAFHSSVFSSKRSYLVSLCGICMCKYTVTPKTTFPSSFKSVTRARRVLTFAQQQKCLGLVFYIR